MNEQDKIQMLKEFGLEQYNDKIFIFNENEWEKLCNFLKSKNFELKIDKEEIPPLDRNSIETEETLSIRKEGEETEFTFLIWRINDFMSPYCAIALPKYDMYIINSNDLYLPHEIMHVKDSIEHPELNELYSKLSNTLEQYKKTIKLTPGLIWNSLLDYSVDTRLFREKNIDYHSSYGNLLNSLLPHHSEELIKGTLDGNPILLHPRFFHRCFDFFLKSEGEPPKEFIEKMESDEYRMFKFFLKNKELKKFIDNEVKYNLLSEKLISNLADILTSIQNEILEHLKIDRLTTSRKV